MGRDVLKRLFSMELFKLLRRSTWSDLPSEVQGCNPNDHEVESNTKVSLHCKNAEGGNKNKCYDCIIDNAHISR